MQRVVQYAPDPRTAVVMLSDIRFKVEQLEFTKQRALSERQFDQLTEGMAGILTKQLTGDPDRMEAAARAYEQLLDQVMLGK